MSCLFNSLSRFVEDDSGAIRQKICDYLETNPFLMEETKAEDIINWESNDSLNNYVSKMRNHSTWGGAIEIRCFCNLYNMNVEVINIRDRKKDAIFFRIKSSDVSLDTSEDKIAKISWNGGHYEPL
jgi:hypothetical protein